MLAVGAAATAEQIALCSLQIRAIRLDPAFAGGDYYGTGARPGGGLALARGIGQISYRTEPRVRAPVRPASPRTRRTRCKGGRYAVESYLEHHGDKLARRFDPNSYVVLSEAMNHHDVGRGRGVARALGRVRADVTVAGIDSDRLYPLGLQHELARLLPGDRPVTVIESSSGTTGSCWRRTRSGRWWPRPWPEPHRPACRPASRLAVPGRA